MLPFFRPKTDEEYVEATRKAVRWAQKLAFIYAISFALVVLGIITLVRAFRTVAIIATANNDPTMLGMRLGILFGVFIGALATCGVLAAVNFFIFTSGDRKDKLLLKYYDALKERESPQAQDETADSSATDD